MSAETAFSQPKLSPSTSGLLPSPSAAGRNRGHHVAVRALAFKWIRVLFRCWQDQKPYNETTYLNALKRSGSPLLAFIAKESLPA